MILVLTPRVIVRDGQALSTVDRRNQLPVSQFAGSPVLQFLKKSET